MSQLPPRILHDVSDVDVMLPAAARAAREYLRANHRPLALMLKPYSVPRSVEKNAALYAHFRDIARHRYGRMDVPERVVEQVKGDFKRTDIWPRYHDPEPDYFTGEVMYRPKSCADLSAMEVKGILQWLDKYMISREIPNYAPADRWEI